MYYDISWKTNSWISTFLSSCNQQGIINEQTLHVFSWIAQETLLGSMSFLLNSNEVTEGVDSEICMFANDAIVYHQINTPSDHVTLESGIQRTRQLGKYMTNALLNIQVHHCFSYYQEETIDLSLSHGEPADPMDRHCLTLTATCVLPLTQSYCGGHTSTTKSERQLD